MLITEPCPVGVALFAFNLPCLTVPDVVFVSETNSSAPANVPTVLLPVAPPDSKYTIKSVFGSEPSAAENPITFAFT